MLTNIHPKLPMRNKALTRDYYLNMLGFELAGSADYDGYLMVKKDQIELHFFEFKDLDPKENYGQVYFRTDDIDNFYQSLLEKKVPIHPGGALQMKPWGQKEFALLEYLVRNKNKVCRRTRIIESVWDIHFDYNTGIIDVFINSLRKKLQLSKGEDYIQTIRGVGYMAKDR